MIINVLRMMFWIIMSQMMKKVATMRFRMKRVMMKLFWKTMQNMLQKEMMNPLMINGTFDILEQQLIFFSIEDIARLNFVDLDVAYEFYKWYARTNEFSI